MSKATYYTGQVVSKKDYTTTVLRVKYSGKKKWSTISPGLYYNNEKKKILLYNEGKIHLSCTRILISH